MRSEKTRGFILKRSNYGEADKILTVFSREKGKIHVLAKGIRRIKSRRAPHLELFNLVYFVLHHGQTLDIVTEARVESSYAGIKANLKLSGFLFYLSEILDKIIPEHQPHPEVFDQLQAHLKALETVSRSPSSNDAQRLTKEFVVQLLWSLGYLPKGEYPKIGITNFVEQIVERGIKSKKFLEEI